MGFLMQLTCVLVAIKTAKDRRSKCRWSWEQAVKNQWFGLAGLIFVVLAEVLGPFATPTYRPSVTENIAICLCAYLLTKALCRKTDLRYAATLR